MRFVSHRDIDFVAWDEAVSRSTAPTVFALSWYLTAFSPGWCALVDDDYSVVMPLPMKRKWGFTLVTQPAECPHLGVFSQDKLSPEQMLLIIEAVPRCFPVVRLTMNRANPGIVKVHSKKKLTFLLSLCEEYNTVSSGYSKHTRRNISKAEGVIVDADVDVTKAMSFLGLHGKHYLKGSFAGVVELLSQRGMIEIMVATDEAEILSVAVFVRNFNSHVYLYSATSPRGRMLRANYKVIDCFIKGKCGGGGLLDFEGSSIPGIARFFAGFGGEEYHYPHLSFVNLPCMRNLIPVP